MKIRIKKQRDNVWTIMLRNVKIGRKIKHVKQNRGNERKTLKKSLPHKTVNDHTEASYLSTPTVPKYLTTPIRSALIDLWGKKMASSKWQCALEIKVIAPLEVVWKIASDYYELHKWFPGLKSSERVEGAPEKGVGSVRRCISSLPSDQEGVDAFGVEELIALDEINHSFTYRMTDTNMPAFSGYQATIQISETGEHDNCLLKWSFEMDPVRGSSKEDIEALFSTMITGMAKNLEQLASAQ